MTDISKDVSVKELLEKVMPNLTVETLKSNNASAELSGTEISMVIDTGSEVVSYFLKDGSSIDVKEGPSENPMLYLKVAHDDVQRMIQNDSLDLLLGLQSDITKQRYNALSSLKGSFVAEVLDDDHTIKIEAVLNGANSPSSVFKMSMKDSAALVRKETNPVNLFMSGAMKIEGDMAFAMATQPLFS